MRYATYQDEAANYPGIPMQAFQRAVQYADDDGAISSAAEACFRTLSHAEDGGAALTLYIKFAWFATISEWVYAFIAARRSFFYDASVFLWGRDYEPPRYRLVAWIFLRMLGLIYMSAFLSFGSQAMGLIGSHGILPLTDYIHAAQSQLGIERYWLLPMVFWFGANDIFIQGVCWAGAFFSALLVLNVLPRLSLALLYILYLSLIHGGRVFTTYQWDMLLVDVGFTALILSLATRPGIWLLRWLMFRFIFLSGVVKVASGDPTWQNLTALNYYFETEPLPMPIAWTMHHLPADILMLLTAVTLFVELVMPFFIMLPRRLRFGAAPAIFLLQFIILLTGNYNFFNLTVLALCVPLLDDQAILRAIPNAIRTWAAKISAPVSGRIAHRLAAAAAVFIFVASSIQLGMEFGAGNVLGPLPILVEAVRPFSIVNTYGPFAVMTTKRNEIVVEGSDDGIAWKEYGFIYKPGDVTRAPLWNVPHQPRLDWQMWFAALDDPRRVPWFRLFLQGLLEGNRDVLDLMAGNPFPDRPPKYVRALYYNYRFSSPEEKKQGIWWDRNVLGIYFPQASLKPATP